jgi:hypothetical protein
MATTTQRQQLVFPQGKPPANLAGVVAYLTQQQRNLQQLVNELNQQIGKLQTEILSLQAGASNVIIGVPNGTRWTLGVDDTGVDLSNPKNPIGVFNPAP